MFCDQQLSQLAERQAWLKEQRWRLVVVHQSDAATAEARHRAVGLADVESVSDPHTELYRAFDLRKGALTALFSLELWKQSFQAFRRGHRQGALDGDAMQDPGAFVIAKGAILSAHRGIATYDLPDLEAMAVEAGVFHASP